MEERTERIVYETLDGLSFSGEPEGNLSDASYAVFRNQITSLLNLSADLPVTDYFSLDVASDADDENSPRGGGDETTTPSLPSVALADNGIGASESAWFRAGSRFKSPMIQLHKEILDFCDFVSPTPEEQALRNAAVNNVFEVVKYIWPHCRVEVFGSFRTGLYLPTSDIDVVILESKVKTPQIGLHALARALSQRSIAKKMQVIAKARVPIVKFVEKLSGISFDISFDMDSGPKAADFIKNAVKKIPPLRPLCLILKVFLQQRELNEVYSGGIGSYTLLAMLIAHLQIQWKGRDLQRYPLPVEHNLGILLVNFFEFYGRKLNTADVGLSCNGTSTFFLKTDKGFLNSERPYLLSIEDPQAADNDIGRNSYNYFKVRSAFSMAYSSLTDAKAIIGLGPHRSILGTIIRPDPVLLDRKGGNNGELTFDTLLPGAGESVPQQFVNEGDEIYNWQLLDDEPLPREKLGSDLDGMLTPQKRRDSKAKRLSRSDSVKASKGRHEANGSSSREVVAKKRRKPFYDDENGFSSRSRPHHWSRSR